MRAMEALRALESGEISFDRAITALRTGDQPPEQPKDRLRWGLSIAIDTMDQGRKRKIRLWIPTLLLWLVLPTWGIIETLFRIDTPAKAGVMMALLAEMSAHGGLLIDVRDGDGSKVKITM